ncbi:MAG TPA: alpha/beta hydrolase [Acidimicrobiales bacterium]|nr:alpha/beta hydrolase [Acidimicrobiales bacterium]
MAGESGLNYDEFSMFADNASEVGLPWRGDPVVRRASVEVAPGRSLSALVWGTEPAELVLLHGGGQNAHTWDTVALALDRPLVAIDLPGHGHSGWPGDARALDPAVMADEVAAAMRALAPEARMLVGMSLGGITAMVLASRHPDLVPRLVLVDVTPGVDQEKSSDIRAFLAGPESFGSFDEILERTIAFNPTRSESSLRRGVLHNAVQREDGTWTWRHQLGRPAESSGLHVDSVDFGSLWDVIGGVTAPTLLVRGDLSPVVDDADVAEFRRRRPDAEVMVVKKAGHSIQGDQPLELARILDSFLHAG